MLYDTKENKNKIRNKIKNKGGKTKLTLKLFRASRFVAE